MSLHIATQPDWQKIPPQKYNFWQRWAAASKGVITPANFISLAGAGMVVWGLFLLLDVQSYWWGVALIITGRLADIADGYVADATGTKSPFGEATDATIDKIVLGLALIFFTLGSIIPLVVAIIFITHTIYNTLIGFIGYYRQLPVHPLKFGKYAAASGWLCLGLFIITYGLTATAAIHTVFNILAWLSLGLFLIFAVPSSLGYARQYTKKRHA